MTTRHGDYRCSPRGSVSMFADFIAFASSRSEFTRMQAVEALDAKWDTVDGYVRVSIDKGLIEKTWEARRSNGALETAFSWKFKEGSSA